MLESTTIDELQAGDDVVIHYYAKPGKSDAVIQCRGRFTGRGASMFGGAEIEYVKVGKKSVLMANIVKVERVAPDTSDADPAGEEQAYCCAFDGLIEQQIALLAEVSDELTRKPPTVCFIVRGEQGKAMMRTAAARLGLGEPVFSEW